LQERICDCTNFWEYQGPCTHAIAAARSQSDDPLALFSNRYTTDYLRRTYSYPVLPISINNLESSLIKPPIIRKQAGRPRKKRFRKRHWHRKQKQCSNGLNWGHSKRTCRGQPVSSGRCERARDWLAEREDMEEEAREEEEDLE
jgi:hypothetical protein